MDLNQSLYRTFMPKIIHYSNDGSGRDNYISTINGGLRKLSVKPDILERKGIILQRKHNRRSSASPLATSFRYYSDGSGRDFYITQNSGGLQNGYIPGGKKDIFKASLRMSPERSGCSDAFSSTMQGWLSIRSRNIVKNIRQTADGVTERLYPKGSQSKPGSPRAERCRLSI
ncbi:unnamed protein product [Blepharisma stoltei]|uniref:Uncharacterized protein n=1 Tax=Blepharisma stoltei TaxID=1481888 RepID=A0AAU9IHD3_9CILI|nr:unnamed protein product [Blepharisma stoltei]